jgi:hypothetical protein
VSEIVLSPGDYILRIVGVNSRGPTGVAFMITHDDASSTTPAKHLLRGTPVGAEIEVPGVGGTSENVLEKLLCGIFGGAACCCCCCIACAYWQRASERRRERERERAREREEEKEIERARESERERERDTDIPNFQANLLWNS